MGEGNPIGGATIAASLGRHEQESGVRSSGQVSNSDPAIEDADSLYTKLNAQS